MKNIPVVILCGGYGTRFREETQLRPKPMIEIGGKPILWHIMNSYAQSGFQRFVLALGYRGDEIKRYFYNYRITQNDFTLRLDPKEPPIIHSKDDAQNWEVTCVDTGLNTLKGGRIKRLEKFLDQPNFHLTYGDGLANIDLSKLHAYHEKHGCTGTVSAVRPPSRFGELDLQGDQVQSFEEKPQLGTGHINGGFFVFKKEFLSKLTADEDCDLEFGALNQLARDGQLKAFAHNDFWQCMDNARDRDYLEKLWNSNEAPWSL